MGQDIPTYESDEKEGLTWERAEMTVQNDDSFALKGG